MDPSIRPRLLRNLVTRPGKQAEDLLRRASIQIEFARAFATLPENEGKGWEESVRRAEAILEGYAGDLSGLSAAVEAAEREMAAIGEAAKGYAIHCVGHGHIDMNWMWSWPETVAMTHDTFASVLSLMEQYPELTFSQSQASVYALTERHYPSLFEAIRARVREGRWEVSAAQWVEGDKNLASGESLMRHFLYTRRYFEEKFGLSAEDVPVAWEPDTFGHANTIPGILRAGGVRFYYSCRSGGGYEHPRIGEARPRLFWWEGVDGSRLLVNRESTWYNSYVNIGDNIALPMVEFARETGLRDWMNVYGIGNHGGGPTRTEIDYLLETASWPVYPRVIFGTSKAWFEQTEREVASRGVELPVLDHELNFEFTGCYTSQSAIKRANRFGENYCVEAETLGAVAARVAPAQRVGATADESYNPAVGDDGTSGALTPSLLSRDEPHGRGGSEKDLLRQAWINVLFNQFHDILPGSGVAATREHALGLFQEVGAITGSIKRNAGQALAAGIDTLSLLPDTPEGREERALAEEGKANTPFVAGSGIGAMLRGHSQGSSGGRRFRPFVVWNPCAWERTELVTVELYDMDLDPSRVVARDEAGTEYPTFFLGKGHDWGHDKLSFIFLATVPALGYRTYLLGEGRANAEIAPVQIDVGERLETPFLKLRFDRYGCGITELTDKRTGVGIREDSEFCDAFGGWQRVTERPRGMTAWALGGEVEHESLRSTHFAIHGGSRNEGTNMPSGGNTLYLVDNHMEVPGTKSTVRVRTFVSGHAPRLDFVADIDWREIGDSKVGIPGLVVTFDTELGEICCPRYETPFGSVERDLDEGEEVPTLRYAHIEATEGSLAGSHDDVHCSLTLLQDSKYGHSSHGGDLQMRVLRSSFDPDHAPEVARSTVRYSVYFHDGPAAPAELTRLGAAWNHPLIVLPANLQAGDAPTARGFADVRTSSVVLTALKLTEDGEGLVLRLVEHDGADVVAEVELDPALVRGLGRAELVDPMERAVEGEATLDGNVLRVPVRANSFATVALR